MGLGGIGADDKDATRFLDIGYGIGHCWLAEGCGQALQRRLVAQVGAGIHVVGAHHCPRQLLRQIVLLIGTLSRSDHPDSMRAILLLDLCQPLCDQIQRPVPLGFGQSPTSASDQGTFKTRCRLHKIVTKVPLDAKTVFVN